MKCLHATNIQYSHHIQKATGKAFIRFLNGHGCVSVFNDSVTQYTQLLKVNTQNEPERFLNINLIDYRFAVASISEQYDFDFPILNGLMYEGST